MQGYFKASLEFTASVQTLIIANSRFVTLEVETVCFLFMLIHQFKLQYGAFAAHYNLSSN